MSRVLTIENLNKNYGEQVAVQSLSFSVDSGELFGLLGPNGAGKTTTINIIVGLVHPTSGKIFIEGIDTQRNPIGAKSLIGFVPDSDSVIEKLTASEFIDFFGRIYEINPLEGAKRKEKMLELFDISSRRGDLLETFSHGMKKKIQIIAALIHSPKLLIIDEPFSALDPEMTAVLKQFLENLPAIGVSVLLATHNLAAAEQICNRVCLINQGQVVAMGKVSDILRATSCSNIEQAYLALVDSKAKNEQIRALIQGW